MRVIVFFDLPTETEADRRYYRKFRRALIKDGFIMLQESVYTKLALNSTQVAQIISDVKNKQPEKGIVQILSVTEKQFAKMEMICGKAQTDILSTDERLVII